MAAAPGSKSLVLAGAVLFLFGLVQGGFVQQFLNPRMALSAHLTAVQSGMALMIVGAVWSWADVSARWSALALWTIGGGMYGLWAGLTLSAATGASDVLPLAGEGYGASPSTETLVSALIGASSAAMILGWLVFVVGLARGLVRPR